MKNVEHVKQSQHHTKVIRSKAATLRLVKFKHKAFRLFIQPHKFNVIKP